MTLLEYSCCFSGGWQKGTLSLVKTMLLMPGGEEGIEGEGEEQLPGLAREEEYTGYCRGGGRGTTHVGERGRDMCVNPFSFFSGESSSSPPLMPAPPPPPPAAPSAIPCPPPLVRAGDHLKTDSAASPLVPGAATAAAAAAAAAQWYATGGGGGGGKPEVLPFLSLCSRYPGSPWAGLLQQTIKEKQQQLEPGP